MRMGLGKEEFFALTPRLFADLRKQFQKRERETHIMLSLVRMDLINFSAARPKERVTLDDLLPPEHDDQARVKRPRLTAKRRQRIADGFRAMFARCIVEKKSE